MSSSAKAKTSTVPADGGEEEEEEEGEEHILNKIANKWMTTRDLMKVCTCAHMCAYTVLYMVLSLKDVSYCDMLWYCLHVFGVTCITVYTVRMCA